jgi:hypothetical protein
MKYGLITIDTPHSNRGNRLIEWALKNVLDLPEPAETAPMFEPLSDDAVRRLNRCDFVLLAGSTILADAPGNSDAIRSLHKLRVPVFCASGSGWAPYSEYLPFDVLRQITPPIGVRDPHALQYCFEQGLEAELVGCPTAYVERRKAQPDKVIVGFGRGQTEWQCGLFGCMNRWDSEVIVASQEPTFSVPLAGKAGLSHFTYDDPEQVYEQYSQAISCYTGRLHGALPAMSQGVSVGFFGDKEDSRFSLLKRLGVTVNTMASDYLNLSTVNQYQKNLDELKAAFASWAFRTIGQFQ